jgi:uncharacterized protein (DUF488 family)
VDVRKLPQSRRPGLSRRALASALADAGVVYEHRRELRNPAAIRAAYRSAERPTAMLCLEADQARCHRDVIAEELVRLHPRVRVEPLTAGA